MLLEVESGQNGHFYWSAGIHYHTQQAAMHLSDIFLFIYFLIIVNINLFSNFSSSTVGLDKVG